MTPFAVALCCALGAQDEVKSPLSPAEEAKHFALEPGYRIELVASDPEIQSPVALAFDEDGRLYVVEMLDYPNPVKGQPPLGRIKRLEDADGDGRYEKSSVFATHLLLGNGVLAWKGGVIATAQGEILYFKDTDGDGKADVREVLFEGFAPLNPQQRMSHPNLGIDNWIYVCNGARGGKVRKPGGADVLDLNGLDFRFSPPRGRHETVEGFGQFGLAFDDWGRRFVCTNRNHLVHLPMPNRYFGRNPFLAPPPPRGDNQTLGGAARVFPLTRHRTLASSHSGTFTAACSIQIWGDSAFTCEPTGNLVHQEVLTPSGATFTGKPPRDGVEFLASRDPWFRPVFLAHGPDGSLYVADFYRSEVEHPEWVPQELRHRYDFEGRKDLGRIWRIVPPKGAAAWKVPQFGKASVEDLVKLLGSPHRWPRMTAHRLLLERQDPATVAPIRAALGAAESHARAHALSLLEGLQALGPDDVIPLLVDAHPRVRETAARLSETWTLTSAPIQEKLLALADDPDGRVRFQAALALGGWEDARTLPALAKIAEAGANDPWTRLAVGSAVAKRSAALSELVKDRTLLRELASIAGSRQDVGEISALLAGAAARDARAQMAILNGIADGLSRRNAQLGAFLESKPEARSTANTLLAQAASIAEDRARDAGERQDAIRLLIHLPWAAAQAPLTRLFLEDPRQEIRVAAVAALSAHKAPEVAEVLLKPWKTAMPALKREILEALSRRPERIQSLLGEVEAGRIASGELSAIAPRLTGHAQPEIRDRAKKLLQQGGAGDRKAVVEQFKKALSLKGDGARGKIVFQKTCASCHRVADLGTNVGPDISDTLGKTPEVLLQSILDPSAAIDANYVNYIVRTRNGNVLSGFVAVQTESSITLARGENQQDVVLRQDIEEMKSSGLSLMPEGLEKTLTVEDMADLLVFLKTWRFIGDPARER